MKCLSSKEALTSGVWWGMKDVGIREGIAGVIAIVTGKRGTRNRQLSLELPSALHRKEARKMASQDSNPLNLSNKKLLSILETMNEWVWEVDPDGTYTYCSSKIKAILGYEPEEALGKTPFDFMVVEDRAPVGARFQEIAKEGKPFFGLVNRNRRKDGSVVVLETNGAPVFNDDGSLAGFVGTDRDITAQVEAQEEVRRRESRLRSIVETMNEWVWEVDANGVYTYSSPKVRTLLGYEPDEVLGKTPFDFMSPEEAERIQAEFGAIVAEKKPFSGLINRNVRKDGTEVILETSGAPVLDDQGELKGFIGTDRDVTAQVHSEAELKERLHTIEEQAAAIRELSTPVMEIWDNVLVLPVVGTVDTQRSVDIMNNLLDGIVRSQAKSVIIDITGVEIVDTKTADYLLKVARAASLLGSRCVLTGLSPSVAQTLVEIGADITEITTLRNLKEGLKDCLRYLKTASSQDLETILHR